jgi:ribosome biogenesis GTPase A
MSIQWFPGHMHLTKKAISERVREIDVVIELLDARLPGSSANPMLAELTRAKPTLKVLNKQDLADPDRTAEWLLHYNRPHLEAADEIGPVPAVTPARLRPVTRAIGLDASMVAPAQRLIQACHELAPQRSGLTKPLRVLICGIPNVGKSTLINSLAGKRAAKTGDEAGITKMEQRIALAPDFYLYDTPGMLWPRIIVPRSGYNLAASGAVGRNAFDDEEVALALVAYLKLHYQGLLEARFKLQMKPDMDDQALLQEIGRKRGALLDRGRVNLQKAAEIVLHEFRAATLGRITLETPGEFLLWLAEGQQRDAERLAMKKNRASKAGRQGTGPA